MKKFILFLIFIAFSTFLNSDEIIKDSNDNFFLLKSDGTFKKLPNPKPGYKYVIKKKTVKTEQKRMIFNRPEKKSRLRTNQGFK
jgi:hypothetical protein